MLINSKSNEIATTTNGKICMENDADSTEFVEQFFRRHNELRKMVGGLNSLPFSHY
jgi:hypothetical protein